MEDDRRTALEEAFNSAEADARGEEYTPPVRETASPDTEVSDDSPIQRLTPETDDVGNREQKAADRKTAKTGDRPRTKGVPPDDRIGKPATAAAETAAADPNQPVSNLDKAPMAWGANRDALWAKVPADVRALVAKREGEIQRGMSDAGRTKAIATEYAELIKPFHNTISHLGTNPRAAIHDVMVTATMMINGTPEVKADIITEMIMRYGVNPADLDARLMKALESGAKPGDWLKNRGGSQPQAPALHPEVAQLLEERRQQKAQQDQQLQNEATTTISQLQQLPHYEDVRLEMADLMEVAAKRGVVLTAQDAYKKAVHLNPEVSKIVGSQPVQSDVSKAASTLARARRAASSVSGSPGSGSLSTNTSDRRATLAAAWDSAG